MASDLGWRCVITTHNGDGQPIFASDESLRELEMGATTRLGRILALPAPATSPDDGVTDAIGVATSPGSLTVDALVVGPAEAGLVPLDVGPPESFEAYIAVQGDLHVVVGPDEAVLHPGDVFIPRGRAYGFRRRRVRNPASYGCAASPIRVPTSPFRPLFVARAGRRVAFEGSSQEPMPQVVRGSCRTATRRSCS